MNTSTLRLTSKEDLVILGLINNESIKGFRRIFGHGLGNLTVDEIVERLEEHDLHKLRSLIDRTFEIYRKSA